ncbi:MAG TPA: hypothetical protein VGG19_05835 [Tepidisphaeraceae bacterium]|jgi:hypothetical protein
MSFPKIAWVFAVLLFTASLHASAPFNQVFLKATHNSYARTPVGTIRQQLDSGCRIVELDIYDTQLATKHDFIIGHSAPGDGVHLGDGNPQTPALSKWLKLINHWSDAHPHCAPIVIYFDLKNGSGYNNGSLALLDDEVSKVFGKKRYLAWQCPGTWPDVDSLRGKVMTVLTGGYKFRAAYRWDRGQNPVIAINAHGQVIEIHESGRSALWFWTGQYESDGTIAWRRHGQLAAGISPSIALDDHGNVIEMHHLFGSSQWFYCQGTLRKNGDIIWQSPKYFSHDSASKIKFHRPITFPLSPQTRAGLPDGRWVSVSTAADTVAPSDILRYSTPTVNNARLTYEQRSFDECDMGDPLLNRDGLLFYTAPFPAGITWGRAAREQGKIVRLWMFNKILPSVTADPPPANYPATDYPYRLWYKNYLQSLHSMQ